MNLKLIKEIENKTDSQAFSYLHEHSEELDLETLKFLANEDYGYEVNEFISEIIEEIKEKEDLIKSLNKNIDINAVLSFKKEELKENKLKSLNLETLLYLLNISKNSEVSKIIEDRINSLIEDRKIDDSIFYNENFFQLNVKDKIKSIEFHLNKYGRLPDLNLDMIIKRDNSFLENYLTFLELNLEKVRGFYNPNDLLHKNEILTKKNYEQILKITGKSYFDIKLNYVDPNDYEFFMKKLEKHFNFYKVDNMDSEKYFEALMKIEDISLKERLLSEGMENKILSKEQVKIYYKEVFNEDYEGNYESEKEEIINIDSLSDLDFNADQYRRYFTLKGKIIEKEFLIKLINNNPDKIRQINFKTIKAIIDNYKENLNEEVLKKIRNSFYREIRNSENPIKELFGYEEYVSRDFFSTIIEEQIERTGKKVPTNLRRKYSQFINKDSKNYVKTILELEDKLEIIEDIIERAVFKIDTKDNDFFKDLLDIAERYNLNYLKNILKNMLNNKLTYLTEEENVSKFKIKDSLNKINNKEVKEIVDLILNTEYDSLELSILSKNVNYSIKDFQLTKNEFLKFEEKVMKQLKNILNEEHFLEKEEKEYLVKNLKNTLNKMLIDTESKKKLNN